MNFSAASRGYQCNNQSSWELPGRFRNLHPTFIVICALICDNLWILTSACVKPGATTYAQIRYGDRPEKMYWLQCLCGRLQIGTQYARRDLSDRRARKGVGKVSGYQPGVFAGTVQSLRPSPPAPMFVPPRPPISGLTVWS